MADFGIMNAAFIVGSALPASAELKTHPPLPPRVAGDGHTGIVGTGPPVAGGLKLTARFFTGGEEGVPDGDAVARLATQTSMV